MGVLLERWRGTLAENRDRLAVWEGLPGRAWTFLELEEAAEGRARELKPGEVVFPQGADAGFLVEVLAGWKKGAMVCPLENGERPEALGALDKGCVGHVKLTSGSTGQPRLVLFEGGALAADADQIVPTMGLRREWPTVGAISLAHSYGFSNLVLPLLLHGIPLRLAGSPLPEAVRRVLPEGEYSLPGVPAMWRAWTGAGVVDARCRLAISAGAPLPVEWEREIFKKCGVKLHNFYGSSECGGIAYDRSELPREEGAPLGTAMDGVRLEVEADGRLVVHSRAVALGYFPENEEDAGVLSPGRFRTGDVGALGPDGVRLLGRAGEAMNLAGRKLHPSELETMLRRHAGVVECVVFAVPSGQGALRTDDAAVVLNLRNGLEIAEVRGWLAGRVAGWKLPRHWRTSPDLAANGRGKISRSAWREWFLRMG